MQISVGDNVEICSDEDGFLGSYYEAKVVARAGKNMFLVEYLTLLDDDNENQPFKEIVDASKVRPVPPQIKVPEFRVLDKVDAYDRDGWWVGRVTSRGAASYLVYFDSSGDEFAYSFCNLRIHLEYENGQWLLPRKKDEGRSKKKTHLVDKYFKAEFHGSLVHR